jgi:coniferyl-aldehyde dehydrogenase
MEDILKAMQAAARADRIPDAATRRRRLAALRRMVVDNRREIVRAIDADFGGRPQKETELLEIVPLLGAIRHASLHLKRWMRDEHRMPSLAFLTGAARVRHEPLGVVGIVAPWNFPLFLSMGPLVDAFAAGNRAMLKPSELTPRFSTLLQRLVEERFAPDELRVITGGVEVGEAFAALPFDHLVFTGSTEVGRKVAVAAARNLTPVTLELGGKSPAIVAPGYPREKAARSITKGKFLNAGQTCIAPDYVLAPADEAEPLARAILAEAEAAWPNAAGNDDYAAIISTRHRERLEAAIEEARDGGATVLQANSGAGDKLPPTVVLGAPEGSVLLREEIFGPVLPVIPYHILETAMERVAAGPAPLALYAFAEDRAQERRILNAARSGGVTVNGTIVHIAQESLPFGGVGASGIGAYHGRDGFRRLSHARAVFRPRGVNLFERLGPPYGRLAELTVRLLGR